MNPIRPYRLLGERAKQNLQTILLPVARQWTAHWFGAQPHTHIPMVQALRDTPVTAQDKGLLWQGQGGRWAALLENKDLVPLLGGMLWHDERLAARGLKGQTSHAGGVTRAVVDQVCRHALQMFAGETSTAAAQAFHTTNTAGKDTDADTQHDLPADAFAPGSAAALVLLELHPLLLTFVLSPAAAVHWLRSRAPVKRPDISCQPARDAIASRRLAVQVAVGGTEITLAELTSLCVGDVIALQQKVDDPSVLRIAGTGIQRAGYLGKHAQKLAIRIME